MTNLSDRDVYYSKNVSEAIRTETNGERLMALYHTDDIMTRAEKFVWTLGGGFDRKETESLILAIYRILKIYYDLDFPPPKVEDAK